MACSGNAAIVTSASAISRARVIICETLACTAPTVGLTFATAAFARRMGLASHVPGVFATRPRHAPVDLHVPALQPMPQPDASDDSVRVFIVRLGAVDAE